MGYYHNVYLKSINRFGSNTQQRIVNKKEYDFNNFVQKSPNKVTAFINDRKFEGVLQVKEYDEINTINYFLTFKSIEIPSGTILKIMDIKNPEDSMGYWIVSYKDEFISAGYNRYTVIKLEREVQWITKDGYLYRAKAHVSGAGANARDNRITSNAKIKDEGVIFLPNQNLTITMQDNENIYRGARVTIKNQVWKISGMDNISNDGVSYVTLEQDYTDENTDLDNYGTVGEELPLADKYKLDRWSFSCSLREDQIEDEKGNLIPCYYIQKDIDYSCLFTPYYFGKKNDSELTITTSSKNLCYENNILRAKTSIPNGEYIIVSLTESPEITHKFLVITKSENEATANNFSVEGPTVVKASRPTKIYSFKKFEIEDYKGTKSNTKVTCKLLQSEYDNLFTYELYIDQVDKEVQITFTSIDGESFSQSYISESPWIGGK